ncbi:1-phosphofructokinase family hexose kinase [Rarobacter incanus]|uniref:1-phosphofructokinase n=1 Tax=Rarobacter incanus TaxID=153494 RepID=A0A542SQ43_9MICO|nr:1-phosphofructokinase family hexose kinase [Rarobacter incanus]TQK76714.1 1-phosphofructokinase [Rarobacter incanus]
MIVTATINPSLDRTVTIQGPLVPGAVHRITSDRTDPGGKGINVAFGTQRAGLETVAVLAARSDDPLLALLSAAGLTHVAAPARGAVRTNLAMVSEPNVTTKVNEPGTPLTASDVDEFTRALLATVHHGDYVVLCGSLAPGVPVDFYATVLRSLKDRGAYVGIDTSDGPLLALAEHFPQVAPDFMKPNAEELGQIVGVDGGEIEDRAATGDIVPAVHATRRLVDMGVREVLVTLGGAGAMLATREGMWFSRAPRVPVVSTVGAGDSAVAGYLIATAQGANAADRLALSVAYGAAAVSLPGTTIPARDDVVVDPRLITRIDRAQRAL